MIARALHNRAPSLFIGCFLVTVAATLFYAGIVRAAGADRVTVSGRTAEVTVTGPNTLRVVLDGQEFTYRREDTRVGTSSSISGPASASAAMIDQVSSAVDQWMREHPEWGRARKPEAARVLIGVLAAGLGLVGAFKPGWVWFVSVGWQFRDAEPSDAALVATRLGGIAAAAAGLWILLD